VEGGGQDCVHVVTRRDVATQLLRMPFTAAEQELYEERAAIREYAGKMASRDAELAAKVDVLLFRREQPHPRAHRGVRV